MIGEIPAGGGIGGRASETRAAGRGRRGGGRGRCRRWKPDVPVANALTTRDLGDGGWEMFSFEKSGRAVICAGGQSALGKVGHQRGRTAAGCGAGAASPRRPQRAWGIGCLLWVFSEAAQPLPTGRAPASLDLARCLPYDAHRQWELCCDQVPDPWPWAIVGHGIIVSPLPRRTGPSCRPTVLR